MVVGTVAFSKESGALMPLEEAGHEVRFIRLGPAARPDTAIPHYRRIRDAGSQGLAGFAWASLGADTGSCPALERLPARKAIRRHLGSPDGA